MLIGETLPFVNVSIEELESALRTFSSSARLTSYQKRW